MFIYGTLTLAGTGGETFPLYSTQPDVGILAQEAELMAVMFPSRGLKLSWRLNGDLEGVG